MNSEFWMDMAGSWHLLSDQWQDVAYKAEADRDEAREIARELARFIRELPAFWPRGEVPFGQGFSSLDSAYQMIRPGVRRWLEE